MARLEDREEEKRILREMFRPDAFSYGTITSVESPSGWRRGLGASAKKEASNSIKKRVEEERQRRARAEQESAAPEKQQQRRWWQLRRR